MSYYIKFESQPLGPGYTAILQSEDFASMAAAVKYLETHDWYFNTAYQLWLHSPGFINAQIRPTSEKHKEGVFQNKHTGEKLNYGPVKLLD